jgi:hypothetical protein
MKRVTSSSFTSRRLKIVIAALLPLLSIQLVGEEPLKELANRHQSQKVEVNKPQLEVAFSDVDLSLGEWTPELQVESHSYLPLSMDDISISLLDEESSSKKASFFRVKKTINFNREIAKKEQEKLVLFFREKGGGPLLAMPKIEKKIQKKHDFLSEKLTFEAGKEKHKKTNPFAFKETEEESDLINRNFSHKKLAPSPSKPSEKIKTARPSQSTDIVSKLKSEEEFSPEEEILSKHTFQKDQEFFCFDDQIIESKPFSFEDHPGFDEKLSCSTLPTGKKKLAKRSDFTDRYLKDLKWEDYSRLTKKSVVISFSPTREDGKKLSKIEQKEIFLELASARPSEISFDDIYVNLSFLYPSFQTSKKSDLRPQIDETFLGELPYYYVKSASQEKRKANCIPSKEKVTPFPSKYSILKGPTLALELNNHVIPFAITPEFDLHVGDSKIELSKKAQEFQTSPLALIGPYLDAAKEVEEKPSQINPTPEAHQGLTLAEEEELALKHSIHHPSIPTYFPLEGLDLSNFETSYSTIKEEQLNLTKQKIAPRESSTEELYLPYVASKKVIPNKAPLVPEKALEDLPEFEKMVELANRDENYHNYRELLEKDPLPVPVKNEIAINADTVANVETEMIHSQAKEIVQDYDQENRHSHGLIALESPLLEICPKESETKSLNQSSRFTNGLLTGIPPPSHLETVTYANEFESEVHYTKREDGKGYYFAIKLKPGEKLNFGSPSQNYIFVLDGSSSIKKHRFGVFKEGVARALSYLSEADSFNIVVADAKMRAFSASSTFWNKGSVAKAKKFLMEQDFRGFFVNYDPFDLISKVTQYFTPDKENIVVLITDGNSFNTLRDHKNDFKELSEANKGDFSIFTATASQGNNLSMLDLLSTFNNGELMYSKTNASFSRQLAVLVKHIESFVAKNVHINVTGATLETGIEFYPNEKTLPSLYADRPYMIYGSVDELKDFDIILQGQAGDQWINIKQSISFQRAIPASHTIKKGMALQKAYVCYDYFMKNEDPFFLSEAQKILEPFNIPTAMR